MGAFTLTVSGLPAKIFYNTPFTFTINYSNTTGATIDNPHPMVFLFPTANMGSKCDPGFRATMAELVAPFATPVSEHETLSDDPHNCVVWWGFDLTHHYSLPNNSNSNWPNVKITARPPNGITALNLKVVIANPAVPDVPYATKQFSIPVATLPPPPSPITPTTHAPAPSPTASPTPSPTDTPSPSDSPIAVSAQEPQPSTHTAADTGGMGLWWIVAGIALVMIGGALLVLLFRWRSRPDEPE